MLGQLDGFEFTFGKEIEIKGSTEMSVHIIGRKEAYSITYHILDPQISAETISNQSKADII